MLPRRIEVRHGDVVYQSFDCKEFKFEASRGQVALT